MSLSLKTIKNEKGENISPILPSDVKNYLIDIDGTICDDVANEEPERMGTCEPYPDALEICNKWYDEGNIMGKSDYAHAADRGPSAAANDDA